MSDPAETIIERCIRERAAPNMALMQLFMAAKSEADARTALEHAIVEAQTHSESDHAVWLLALKQLWHSSPGAYRIVTDVYRTADARLSGSESDRIHQLAQMFDQAASISPDAAVALYSLGNRELLDDITGEIIDVMSSLQLFDCNSVVADLGCGSGRFVRSLASRVRGIIGVDISDGMLRTATGQASSCDNALFIRSTGFDLRFLRSDSFDLVMAIDSFPYVVQAGAIGEYFRDCARVLRAPGHLLVMNFAYNSEIAAQRAQIADLAASVGFSVLRNGTNDLKFWDGKTFLLKKRN